jgi:hypothetical protein
MFELTKDWFSVALEQFHKTLKRDCYAMLYGNEKATIVWDDFATMLLMGGEL